MTRSGMIYRSIFRRSPLRACGLAFLALAAAALTPAPAAYAMILQIAAPGFTVHCPCATATTPNVRIGAVEPNGLLEVATGNYFAPVMFPTDGVYVCSFSVVFEDDDFVDGVTASLAKRPLTLGGSASSAAVTMATLQSSGHDIKVRRLTTAVITQPKVATSAAFYYVELQIPRVDLNVLGVQLDVRPSCR